MPADSLAEFELLVMLAALRLGPDDAYTVSIADDITEHTGRPVRRANVYTTLQRLEHKGSSPRASASRWPSAAAGRDAS